MSDQIFFKNGEWTCQWPWGPETIERKTNWKSNSFRNGWSITIVKPTNQNVNHNPTDWINCHMASCNLNSRNEYYIYWAGMQWGTMNIGDRKSLVVWCQLYWSSVIKVPSANRGPTSIDAATVILRLYKDMHWIPKKSKLISRFAGASTNKLDRKCYGRTSNSHRERIQCLKKQFRLAPLFSQKTMFCSQP